MKKIFPFVEKANQFLLFGALIFFCSLMVWEFILKDFFRTGYRDPKVELVDSTGTENRQRPIKYYKQYYRYIKDTHIIRIKSDAIDISQGEYFDTVGYAAKSSYEKSDNKGTVNLLFVKANQPGHLLFEKDMLITDISTQSIDDDDVDDKLILEVVEKDSDGDGFLSYEDDENLYIANHDGSDLILIQKNILSYRVVDSSILMVQIKEKEESNEKDRFFEYNINTGVYIELNTDI